MNTATRASALPTFFCNYASPLGTMVLAARGDLLGGLWFEDQQHMPDMTGWVESTLPVLQQAQAQLNEYFAGTRRVFDLPLATGRGTVFQTQVWAALQSIGYGQSSSYGVLAQAIGNPKAVRAVGAAVGRNPWSIVVPCHRVLGSNGTLTGYAGGLDRKRALLKLENLA